MTDFHSWTQKNLANFATKAQAELDARMATIIALREDLRVALDAYRALVVKQG